MNNRTLVLKNLVNPVINPSDPKKNSNTSYLQGYLRLPDILKLIPVGKATWWRGVKSGLYPQPVKIGTRITAWKIEDIQNLMIKLNNQPTGCPDPAE